MVRKSSPPGTGVVTLDIDAEIAALEAANDRDRQAEAELQARIRGREENVAFLRGLLSRVGSTVTAGVLDGGIASGAELKPAVRLEELSDGATYVGPKLTQKFMSLCALDGAPSDAGLMAIEVINFARERFPSARPIERTSLSPLLAKMADPQRGPVLVTHRKTENRWSITDEGRRELRRLRGETA